MPTGQAVDRSVMDASLVEVAERTGVHFVSPATGKLAHEERDARVVTLQQRGKVAQVRCKAVILACGLGNRSFLDSAESGLAGLQQTASPSSRIGIEALVRDFPAEYVAGKLHMAVGRTGYVGLTQIAGQRLHVAAALDRRPLQSSGPASSIEQILRESGAPQWSLDDSIRWRGTPPLTARPQRVAAERVFLVGDAAGYVEPFTGEGIRWALETGMAVVDFASRASDEWKPALAESWNVWYRRRITGEQRLCRRIAAGLKRPAMRFLAHQLLRVRPRMAAQIITRLNSESAS
jgi:flavin-dependent dehydrogenase